MEAREREGRVGKSRDGRGIIEKGEGRRRRLGHINPGPQISYDVRVRLSAGEELVREGENWVKEGWKGERLMNRGRKRRMRDRRELNERRKGGN